MTTGGDISKISSMSGAACWYARTAEEVLWGLQEDNGTAFLLTSAQAQSGDVRSMVLHQLSGDFQRPEPNPINVLPGLDRESLCSSSTLTTTFSSPQVRDGGSS